MAKQRKAQTLIALDVGTSKVATIVAQKTEDLSGFDIIGVGNVPISSMRKGTVIDLEDTISAISSSLEEAERMSGVAIERSFVSIGGDHIESTNSKGVIAVSGQDGEITAEDTERVVEASRAISQPTNREMLHVIPRLYAVDGQSGIKDPIGMTGIRLEVDAHVISASTPAIKNLTKCIYQAGLDVEELVYSGLASSYSMLTKKQKEIGVVLVDIGAGTTDVVVFEEGDILHSASLPFGSSSITNDVAIGLKTSIPTAEEIKIKHGTCQPDEVSEGERIDLSEVDKKEQQEASAKYLAEIIEARVSEILNLVKKELKSINRDGMLPSGVVLCGGGAKLKGLAELSKKTLRLPSTVGTPCIELSGLIDKINDPSYASAIGLILYGLFQPQKKQGLFTAPHHLTGRALASSSKIKDWFKQFLP